MQQYKKKLHGYFTVEAAMIIPIVIFIIAFLIYAAFLVYGRCIMIQDSYLLALEASLVPDMNDPDTYVREKAVQRFGRKYFGNDLPEVHAWKKDNHIYVATKTITHHRAIDGYDLLNDKTWEIGSQMRADINDPSGKIRKLERIRDLAETGIRQLKQNE